MKRGHQMRRFYQLARRLSAETDMARRYRIAMLMCKVERRIALTFRVETIAWLKNRKASYYAPFDVSLRTCRSTREVTQKAAA